MRHCAAFSLGSIGPRMQNQLFEAALGIAKPWYVRGVDFDAARKVLTIGIDFVIEALNGLLGRQTQSPRLYPLRHHAHRAVPHRRQARLRPHQPPRRLTHSTFKRATISFAPMTTCWLIPAG